MIQILGTYESYTFGEDWTVAEVEWALDGDVAAWGERERQEEEGVEQRDMRRRQECAGDIGRSAAGDHGGRGRGRRGGESEPDKSDSGSRPFKVRQNSMHLLPFREAPRRAVGGGRCLNLAGGALSGWAFLGAAGVPRQLPDRPGPRPRRAHADESVRAAPLPNAARPDPAETGSQHKLARLLQSGDPSWHASYGIYEKGYHAEDGRVLLVAFQ